jgi:hypothetical protein
MYQTPLEFESQSEIAHNLLFNSISFSRRDNFKRQVTGSCLPLNVNSFISNGLNTNTWFVLTRLYSDIYIPLQWVSIYKLALPTSQATVYLLTSLYSYYPLLFKADLLIICS